MMVTFIIPTLGRDSLVRTLQSLQFQTNPDWKALVIFDGCPVTFFETDKIKTMQVEKIGSAGLVRNLGLPLVDTEWTAFVDDDDYLKNTYVDRLLNHWGANNDIVIFTYRDVENGNTQPPLGTVDFSYCHVGISFAVRTDFIKSRGITFQREGIEDFFFLDACRRYGAKYVVTNDIQYFVGHRSAWGTN